jgi:hypothetical protein
MEGEKKKKKKEYRMVKRESSIVLAFSFDLLKEETND